MKTKLILIVALAAAFGAAAVWLMPHHPAGTVATSSDRKILYYTCPMHPAVKNDKPGDCPICGMKLQPVYSDANNTNSPAAAPASCCSSSANP